MSYTEDQNSKVIEKIVKASAADDDTVEFSKAEMNALKSVAQVYLALLTLGRAATAIRSILTYIGWAIAFWLLLRGGAIDWLKSVVGK